MVFVLDKHHEPLMPCTEKRARLLLQHGRAVVHRVKPFVIRLKDRLVEDSVVQPCRAKVDVGYKVSGLAVVRDDDGAHVALHLAEVQHRGWIVQKHMVKRLGYRRQRRSKLRYRQPRFNNRRRPPGWLPPSIRSRRDNILSWLDRYRRWAPIVAVDLELMRFDTQLMEDPDIAAEGYQQGTLWGYELREYLLERDGRLCAYCGKTGVPLQIEHITPKSRNGSSRVGNLTLACGPCNQRKGNQTAAEFGYPEVQTKVRRLKTTGVQIMRASLRSLCEQRLTTTCWTGGRTKWNRSRFGVEKSHAADALCCGEVAGVAGADLPVLCIEARGRGSHARSNVDGDGIVTAQFGRVKIMQGFQTGDLARYGEHFGRISARARGSHSLFVAGVKKPLSVQARKCRLVQRADGFKYS